MTRSVARGFEAADISWHNGANQPASNLKGLAMNATQVSPERITQLATGGWAAATLGAAVSHSVFTHVDRGHRTVDEIAKAAGLSPRGALALVDGAVGIGLLSVRDGKYENTPEAAAYLVEGKPSYFGGFAKFNFTDLPHWARLGDVVRSGAPADDVMKTENPFWEELVISIAPWAFPMAEAAGKRLNLVTAGPISILDVGGGSGAYSAALLRLNAQAISTQLDWSNVNRVAREFVARHGVSERFHTIDGDFHATDFGESLYDVAIYSHIAHGEPPKENIAVFRKFRRALKPGGSLIVVDFVQTDDRSGPPFALLFHLNMLVHTVGGATYREADYRAWLTEADFRDIALETTAGPASLIYAS
jgi:ubiquinone/menaquinone biosynthesis C-methylase UbiE